MAKMAKDGWQNSRMAKMVSKSLNPLQYALSIFSRPISRDYLGEEGIHLRKDQDLYLTIEITLEAI